jgi:hypothetical protein
MKRTKFPKRKGISVSARKSKGRNLQKWTAVKISELTGFEAGKDKPIESRGMGQTGVDVRLETCVLEKFPFSVECKRQEAKSIPFSWIAQSKANVIPNTDWLLVVKRNHEDPTIIMDAEQFFVLMNAEKFFLLLKELENAKSEIWGVSSK